MLVFILVKMELMLILMGLEILINYCDLNIEEKELFFCIYDIVLHILTYDINLKDKDILKFEDGKEIKFIKSQGISVENESLKIIF